MEFSRRRYERYRFRAPVELSWVEDGSARSGKGINIDVSCYGMQVRLDAPIGLDTTVLVRIEGKRSSASAKVRHCGEFRAWFRIGVQFNQTLLSEDIPTIHQLLTKSLPTSNEERVPTITSRDFSAALLRKLAVVHCLLAGHDFTWAADSRGEAAIVCERCNRVVPLIVQSSALA